MREGDVLGNVHLEGTSGPAAWWMKRKEVYFLLSTSSLCLLSFVSSLQDNRIVFLLGKTRPFPQPPLGWTYLTLQNLLCSSLLLGGWFIPCSCALLTGTKAFGFPQELWVVVMKIKGLRSDEKSQQLLVLLCLLNFNSNLSFLSYFGKINPISQNGLGWKGP